MFIIIIIDFNWVNDDTLPILFLENWNEFQGSLTLTQAYEIRRDFKEMTLKT